MRSHCNRSRGRAALKWLRNWLDVRWIVTKDFISPHLTVHAAHSLSQNAFSIQILPNFSIPHIHASYISQWSVNFDAKNNRCERQREGEKESFNPIILFSQFIQSSDSADLPPGTLHCTLWHKHRHRHTMQHARARKQFTIYNWSRAASVKALLSARDVMNRWLNYERK